MVIYEARPPPPSPLSCHECKKAFVLPSRITLSLKLLNVKSFFVCRNRNWSSGTKSQRKSLNRYHRQMWYEVYFLLDPVVGSEIFQWPNQKTAFSAKVICAILIDKLFGWKANFKFNYNPWNLTLDHLWRKKIFCYLQYIEALNKEKTIKMFGI